MIHNDSIISDFLIRDIDENVPLLKKNLDTKIGEMKEKDLNKNKFP